MNNDLISVPIEHNTGNVQSSYVDAVIRELSRLGLTTDPMVVHLIANVMRSLTPVTQKTIISDRIKELETDLTEAYITIKALRKEIFESPIGSELDSLVSDAGDIIETWNSMFDKSFPQGIAYKLEKYLNDMANR